MKKIISLALALVMVLALTACGGGKTVSAPEDSVYKADVQDYITDVLDSSAEISIFEKKTADLSGTTLTVTCIAIYEGDSGETKATFILTYSSESGDWELEKCRVEMDETNTPAETTKPVETTPPETTAPPAPQVAISDNWQDFTFELGGYTYKLPCHYSEFAKNGFVIGGSYSDVQETDKLNGYSYVFVTLTNGAVSFNAELINLSGNARVASDCDVGSITVEARDNLGLKLAKGIHSLSTVEEIQAAFGTPSNINSSEDYTSMTYRAGDYVDMKFYISSNTTYNEITLSNHVASERDATVPSTERPAYLDTYVAPTSLSNAPTSTQFQLDGVVYHLPCPLSVFTDNGWTVKSDSIGSLGAGNHSSSVGSMTLEKDGVKVSVYLKNFAEIEVTSANCAVTDVDLDEYYMKDAPKGFMKLPTGLTFDSTAEDIAKACNDFEVYEGSSSVSYTAENQEYTWQVKYYLYEDDLSVSIKDTVWDY